VSGASSFIMVESFHNDGFVLLTDHFDVEAQIQPIKSGIREIIQIVANKHGVDAPCTTNDEAMTSGLMTLAAVNREYASEVYDAVKQLPEFMQLVVDSSNVGLFRKIRPGSRPGIAAGGYGIRIDFPHDAKYRTFWHQEFPAQLRSLDGIVFWSPLLPVDLDSGPVQICCGSHKSGMYPTVEDAGFAGKEGAYALRLASESKVIEAFDKSAPLSRPGDLILMDFLAVHQSGENRSKFPRWSMQYRLFNFNEPTGIKIGWRGSFVEGLDFTSVLSSTEF
jgi:hypothetical protein